MKRLILSLLTAAMLPLGTWADVIPSSYYSAFSTTDQFYLYNIGQQKFLNSVTSTKYAVFSEKPVAIQFTGTADNCHLQKVGKDISGYTDASNNELWGDNGTFKWSKEAAKGWGFKFYSTNESNIYYFGYDDKGTAYYFGKSDGESTHDSKNYYTLKATVSNSASGDDYKWALIKVSDYNKYLIDQNNGVATSLITNADCSSITGWTNASANSSQAGPFGSNVNCFEQSSTNVVSQTLSNMPAGTYLLQACIRGGNTKVTVALGETSKEYQLVNGNNENAGTTWTSSRAIASAETYVGSTGNKGVAYNGWLKAEFSYTLNSAGDLTISFTPSSNTWTQIYDVRLFKTDATGYATQTSATTDATTTEVDLTSATTFSLFDLGVNKNALVKVGAGSAIASTENVINSDNTCTKLVLRDGAFDFGHTGESFTATSVTYDRTFTANNASTVCLPFALTSTEASALGTFYTLRALSGTTLTFETVSAPAAYTPYLFVPTATAFSSYSSKSISTTPASIKTSVSGADFIGTMTAQTLKSNGSNTLYGYKNGQFVKIGSGSGAHINPFRAYISIPGSSPAPSFSIDFGGETTGINAVHGEGLKVNGYYNLNGQRVSQPSKGLYIMNGKKVIIK